MSKENDVDILDPVLEEATSDLREDDLKKEHPKPFLKPVLHVDTAKEMEGVFTPEQIILIAKMSEEKTRKAINNAVFVESSDQIIDKSKVAVTDFSKITLDDVYNLEVPIEAKPFMSADVLAIKLKDTNYEARWVNKNPQNLGDKLAKGFTYIEPRDLLSKDAEAIKTGVDAEGHFCFNDVVAMKIDKATYFRALRAAHERAVNTTNEAALHKRAAKSAGAFMEKESGYASDYRSAAVNKKMVFYDPGVEA